MEDSTDISKSTVVILVILTLAVSMVGTWAVLEEVVSTASSSSASAGADGGKVQLRIVDPQDVPIPQLERSSGQVGITINPAS